MVSGRPDVSGHYVKGNPLCDVTIILVEIHHNKSSQGIVKSPLKSGSHVQGIPIEQQVSQGGLKLTSLFL